MFKKMVNLCNFDVIFTWYVGQLCPSGVVRQGRIQDFWKGGPGKGAKPRTERRRRERRRGVWGASSRKFWKIRCNFLQSGIYFWDQNGLGYHSKLGLCLTKNSSGHDFDSHTHAYTSHTSKNSSDFGHYKIQIKFQKYFFRQCIPCKEIKLTLPKIGGPAPSLDLPL